MVLRILYAIGLLAAFTGAASAGEGFFPFVVPARFPAASVIRANWIEAPAGRRGPVVVRDGHFYTGDRRIRFFGVNLAYVACFPAKADAEAVSVRLSRLGVNLVRFHFLDAVSPAGLIAAGRSDTRTLDRELLARLDYFVAKLKAHGVYSDLNLYCGHRFAAGDGVAEADRLSAQAKYVTLFDAGLIALQKDFARKLLLHKNPYTKLTYARDPAVALVEITNENSFLYAWSQGALDDLPQVYASELDAAFREFLAKRGMAATERPRWKDKSPNAPAYIEFLMELESRYFRDMYSFLKHDLGVEAQVTGTMAFGPVGARMMAGMDFVDCHAYWEHPQFSEGAWKGPWTVGNTPMAATSADNALVKLAAVRVAGKPYTVSEYNHPFPSFYDAEAIPLAAAFAARQDWDALVMFDYSMSTNWEQNSIRDFFQINGHPVKTAELLAASAVFVRGDLPPAKAVRRDVVAPDRLAAAQSSRIWWDVKGMMADLGLSIPTPEVRHYLAFAGEPIAPSGVTTDPAFRWSGDGKTGLMIADSAASKSAVGFFGTEPVRLGSVSLALEPGFASVTVTSLDGKPVEASSKLLVTACGQSANTGMKWNGVKNSLESWGGAPALAEGIAGRVELPGELVVFALDSGGAPVRRVPTNYSGGVTGFEIRPEYSALWYVALRAKR